MTSDSSWSAICCNYTLWCACGDANKRNIVAYTGWVLFVELWSITLRIISINGLYITFQRFYVTNSRKSQLSQLSNYCEQCCWKNKNIKGQGNCWTDKLTRRVYNHMLGRVGERSVLSQGQCFISMVYSSSWINPLLMVTLLITNKRRRRVY